MQDKADAERAKKIAYLRAKIKNDVFPFVQGQCPNVFDAKEYVQQVSAIAQNAAQTKVRELQLKDLNVDMFIQNNEKGQKSKKFFEEYAELSVMDAVELLNGLPMVIDTAVKKELAEKTLDDLHVAEILEEQTQDVPTQKSA